MQKEGLKSFTIWVSFRAGLERADPAPRCPSQGDPQVLPHAGTPTSSGGERGRTGMSHPITSPVPPAPPRCPRHTRARPAETAAGAWFPAAGNGSGTAPSSRRSRTSAGKGIGSVRCLRLCTGGSRTTFGMGWPLNKPNRVDSNQIFSYCRKQ